MNKSSLRHFATHARTELLERVELQALKLGITKDKIDEASLESSDSIVLNGKPLNEQKKKQRDALIRRIDEIGFDRVIEETAYTWFNRFIALRFMEVNNYLPTRVRVLSSESEDSTEPDMIREALELNLDIDKQYVYDLKMANKTDELFKYLIQLHCNELNEYMPFMFETIEDYMMILFPEGLLGTESFIREMTDTEVIPEEDWQQVEIIGWLYQYYISEENRRVIQAKKQYKSEELPAATQLFTPKWIVKYMVQNSLGRYWVESNPSQSHLTNEWEFYLKNREADYEEKIKQYANENVHIEEITCFDPAMGSGHILVYMFDVLFQIYRENGYIERDIPRLIIENNLYGLDIDKRAYQLACFSLVMKALQYNRRFLRSIKRDGLQMNLAVIEQTNELTYDDIVFLAGSDEGNNYEQMNKFIEQFKDAKEIGSLLKVQYFDEEFLYKRLQEIKDSENDLFVLEKKDKTVPLLQKMIKQSKIMTKQFDVFVSNPPYVGNRYIPIKAKDYINEHYKDVKRDMFSAFMKYSFSATKENGQIGFMTPYVWMFIATYEKLREKIIHDRTISSLIQLEYSGFDGATVPICTFTLRNYPANVSGEYIRLSDFKGAKNQSIKTLEAIKNPNVHYRYTFDQHNYNKIPGKTFAYWVSENVLNIFQSANKLGDISRPRVGQNTGDNKRFLRFWYEVAFDKITFDLKNKEMDIKKYKWIPYNKGGSFRKWYGNQEFIVNWENNGEEIKEYAIIRNKGKHWSRYIQNVENMCKPGVTWTFVSSSKFAVRYLPSGFICDVAGSAIFPNSKLNYYLLGFLNTKLTYQLLNIQNPTLNFQAGNIANLPYKEEINSSKIIKDMVSYNINISKSDWDSFETSWDFERHPFLTHKGSTVEESYRNWAEFAEKQFYQLKENEEKLNEIFIEIYGLEDELTREVDEEDVTVRKADLERDIKSFISYAVGCMFGRYSLDEDGLIYVGGNFDPTRYKTFKPDEDNIIPIVDGNYFEDDVVNRFVEFVKMTYGENNVEENLQYIADVLGKRTTETSREAIRRYFLNNFYKDHTQTYKKHPIYWLFSSGREKAFNCLVYMHRYDKTTLSRIRTDYLHEVQTRYETRQADLLSILDDDTNLSSREKREAQKELTSIDKKLEEIKTYDEKLHHKADTQIEIDLDDGVKVNYKKFDGLVAKI